jgi:hypothetical protein
MNVPAYDPPSHQRASVAAGFAPLIVLVTFTLLVTRLIDADTFFAWAAATTVWVCWELHDFQRALDAYDADYARRHLAWRSPASIEALIADERVNAATRAAARRFLHGGRAPLHGGRDA